MSTLPIRPGHLCLGLLLGGGLVAGAVRAQDARATGGSAMIPPATTTAASPVTPPGTGFSLGVPVPGEPDWAQIAIEQEAAMAAGEPPAAAAGGAGTTAAGAPAGAMRQPRAAGVTRPADDLGPPGALLQLDLSQGLSWSDNPDLLEIEPSRDTIVSETMLGLSYEATTRVSRLNFGLSGTFEAGDMPQEKSSGQITARAANLGYQRQGPNSLLQFDTRMQRNRASGDVVFDDFTGEDLVVSGGDRETLQAGGGLQLGIEGPLGASLSGSYSQTRYFDTPTDTAGHDRYSLDAETRLQLAPVTNLFVTSGISRDERDDERNYTTEDRFYGIGVGHELSAGTRLRFDLRQTEIETSETLPDGSRSTETESGAGVILDVSTDRPNGTLGLGFSSLLYDTSRRETLSLSRNLETRGGSVLALSLGATHSENGINPAVTAEWIHEGKRDRFAANLSQQVGGDEDTEVLRTSLGLSWDRELTQLSTLGASVSLADSSPTSDDGDQSRRTTFTLDYTHDLTEDWAMAASLSHRKIESDSEDDRSNNTLFLGLERSFKRRLR
ncbi:MAG: hypothetical protein H5U17_10720 [Defluviimonas sp.]|nr:hypothetical protein [Defluviimonas sp.]